MYGSGIDVVALHGFTLTGAQFASTANAPLRVHAPDLPGHGATSVTPVTIDRAVDAVGRYLSTFPTAVPLVGYSQGGRIALLTALAYPQLVDRLVLISTSPGISDPVARAERQAKDRVLADRIETIGLSAFLDAWLAAPITGTTHIDKRSRIADRKVREENTATGLAAALRGMGQGVQPYVGDRPADLEMPLLTISGGTDNKYQRFGIDMADTAPRGRHVTIAGVGHNVVLEAPDEVRRLVLGFVSGTSATD